MLPSMGSKEMNNERVNKFELSTRLKKKIYSELDVRHLTKSADLDCNRFSAWPNILYITQQFFLCIHRRKSWLHKTTGLNDQIENVLPRNTTQHTYILSHQAMVRKHTHTAKFLSKNKN